MERPELFPDLVYVYEAFFTLSLGRQYNEAGPQPLSYSDLILYANQNGITSPEDKQEFGTYIRTMDSRYLELSHEKIRKTRERLNKQSASGNKGSRKRR